VCGEENGCVSNYGVVKTWLSAWTKIITEKISTDDEPITMSANLRFEKTREHQRDKWAKKHLR